MSSSQMQWQWQERKKFYFLFLFLLFTRLHKETRSGQMTLSKHNGGLTYRVKHGEKFFYRPLHDSAIKRCCRQAVCSRMKRRWWVTNGATDHVGPVGALCPWRGGQWKTPNRSFFMSPKLIKFRIASTIGRGADQIASWKFIFSFFLSYACLNA